MAQAPSPEPDLVPRGELRGHRREGLAEVLDLELAQGAVEERTQAVAAQQPAAGHAEVEVAHDPERVEVADPVLERVELPGEVRPAHERSDRRACHHVDVDAGPFESLENADVSPASAGTASQRETDTGRGRHGFAAFRGTHSDIDGIMPY